MQASEAPKAKFFCGIMYSDDALMEKVKGELSEKYGKIDAESEPYLFERFTSYYEQEMGKGLKKMFAVFKEQMPREALADMKLFANSLEVKHSTGGKRLVNIDPGYLADEHLILASCKASPYRIYLGKGIYAMLTLIFQGKKCIPTERTFPDFKSREVQEFFSGIRKGLIKK